MKVKIIDGIQHTYIDYNINHLPRVGDKIQTYYSSTGSPKSILLVNDIVFDFNRSEINIYVK